MSKQSTATKDRGALSRADWITVNLVLLGFAIFIVYSAFLVPIISAVTGGGVDAPLDVDITVPVFDQADVRYDPFASVDTYIDHPTTAQRLLVAMPGIMMGLFLVAGALLVLAVVRDISTGHPFAERNVSRLRALGWIIIVSTFAFPLVTTIAGGEVYNSLDLVNDEISGASFTLSFMPLGAGLVALTIAQAFRIGQRLTAEVEGLV